MSIKEDKNDNKVDKSGGGGRRIVKSSHITNSEAYLDREIRRA